jgi:hypothetical protein
MANGFKKKRLLVIVCLFAFAAILYAGFRYWQYANAVGSVRTFTGTVTYIPEVKTPCMYYEVNKDMIVRVSCNGELGIVSFTGKYDSTIKLGDKVQARAVRFDPHGVTNYKMYDIRAANTYIQKVQ